jgi:hypothetical protein
MKMHGKAGIYQRKEEIKTTALVIIISLGAVVIQAKAGNVLPNGVEPFSSQELTDK